MRIPVLIAVAVALASAQPRDADRAYAALRARDYDAAVPSFLAAIQAAPARADIRKDLAYTYLNIDDPLALGIARWQRAILLGGDNFSGHFELATLAEQRDELALAATHFERAWRLLPDRRTVLVDLGRVWLAMGRSADATSALLAAAYGGEPRAAEMARELLPPRYPF